MATIDPTRKVGSNLDDDFGIPLPFVVWRHFPPSVEFYIIKQALTGPQRRLCQEIYALTFVYHLVGHNDR